MSVSLTPLGTYATGVFDEGAAEINAYDPASKRLFVVNSDATTVDILDLSDPTSPSLIDTIDASALGGGANSVAISNGIVAVAIEAETSTDPGSVVFFNAASGKQLNQVTVGALPDMVTFTPDGSKVLVANEGEPDDGVDPEGSVSIIDLSGGVASLTQANVATAGFTAFNGRENDLRGDGVRIFPDASAAQDFEPEFIAVSPDGEKAFVTLQEANSVAVVDIATATVEGIQPLGVKDHSKGLPQLTNYDITDRGLITNGGDPLATSEGETIELGGFSGLWFDGVAENGNLKFLAVPDRGPNGDADGNNRPFLLPDYQARVVSLELNESTGTVSITDELLLQQANGTPITGLPNIPNVDRQAVDASGSPVDLDSLTQLDASVFGADYDPFGADLEGIIRVADGSFWMVDEYRPAIYHFDQNGSLINRFVPEGTVAEANAANPNANFAAGTFGSETLPAEYLNRRRNRGFEGMALDTDNGILYAFIQTPMSNPNRAAGDASNVIRMIGIDPSTGEPVAEYVYNIQDPEIGSNVDKIGDAVYAGNGKFFVMERDSALPPTAQKFVFEVDITGATNVLGRDFGEETLEQQTTDDLIAAGIQPVNKIKVTNLPSIGYLPSDKPEGLALLPDGRLAVLNDNDFGLEAGAEAVQLGIIDFATPNGLDASDRDDQINIQNQPVFGLLMPDAIASYEANGITYYVTANEGDDRGDADEDARGDAIRLGNLGDVTSFGRSGLALDERFDPALLDNENLGRLNVSTIDGDLDGDGDLDQIFAYGSRSFSIFDENGNLVFDSGSQLEEITAEAFPNDFNSTNDENDSLENRSDNKGPEPEGVTIGEVNGKTLAFVGLERIGGVAVYDISNPAASEFVQYINTRDFSGDAAAGTAGDLGPEGLTFISAADSPNGEALLAVSNEVSGTTTIFQIDRIATDASIFEIQGAGHVSPLEGSLVNTTGIVTAVAFNGFYLQDPTGDGDDTTSDGIFIFDRSGTVAVGDEVKVGGTVSEFIPGGASTGNLSITQISAESLEVVSSGNALPEAVVIGQSGRLQSNTTVISEDELPVNLQETAGEFNPENDAIDFYETLEGQLVTVEDAIAVSPTRVFGRFSAEAFVLPNQGEVSDDPLNARGGMPLASGPDNTGDQNPERVQIQFDPTISGQDTPLALNVGDQIGDVTGVVGYSFGNFEVNVTGPVEGVTPGRLEPEVTELVGTEDQLTVASYNVLNLTSTLAVEGDTTDPDDAQRTQLAQQVVNNLGSPDIIALQEIQDNNGVEGGDNAAVSDATQTLQDFVDAIAAAGGPTYEFFDVYAGGDAAEFTTDQGGVPSGNIRNAFLYNPDRVTLNAVDALTTTALTDAGVSNPEAFEGSRIPVVGHFSFNGETVTIVNNHFSSRFGSTPVFGGVQPFIQAGEEAREAQSLAINEYVDSILATDADANVVVTGDLNTFQFTNDLAEILPGTGDEQVLTNLIAQAEADGDAYTFIFDGNSQVLDHLYVTDGLAANAEFEVVHVNNDFTRDDNAIQFDTVLPASDHEPLVSRLDLSGTPMTSTFTLELLHAADQEGGIPALADAPNFSAVLNALKAQDIGNDDQPDNTLTLSSGDAIIPGAFFNASEEAFGEAGRADILIQNELGFQAIALGNHEFDQGTGTLADLIAPGSEDGSTYPGTAFPYLSSNLDFSSDEDLASLVVEDAQAPVGNSLAASTIIDVNGEPVLVVGATTPTLPTISSSGDVTVLPTDFDGTPSDAQLDALAAEIQNDVDAALLFNPTINKVIVLAHMQQLSIEEALAERLVNVDIIVAGGSNTRLVDEDDRLRAGDAEQGIYPIIKTDAEGKPVAVVNTDGNYKYVGRLVIDFDKNGNIIPESYDPTISGAYATDAEGVAALNAEGLVDPEIQGIVDELSDVIAAADGAIFGSSNVFLNGTRGDVRTQETNLGNLTADANLAIAKEADSTVTISLKNGGGIRDNIGVVTFPAGSTNPDDVVKSPTAANPLAGKEEGDISQLDIANTLRFNNGLTLLTVTAAELEAIIEHAVGATEDGATPGRFPQVAGIQFSFDDDQPEGDRVQSLVVLNENGEVLDTVIENGELVGDASRTFRMVTLSFLADGGDGYPFPTGDAANVVQLAQEDDAPRTGAATFAPDGSEQDALAEYLAANFSENEFDIADVGPEADERIQNLDFRKDTIIPEVPDSNPVTGDPSTDEPVVVPSLPDPIQGDGDLLGSTDDEDFFVTGDNTSVFAGEGMNRVVASGDSTTVYGGSASDLVFLGNGDNLVFAGEGVNTVVTGEGNDLIYGGAQADTISSGSGNDVVYAGNGENIINAGAGNNTIYIGSGSDTLILSDAGSTEVITFGSNDKIRTGGLDAIATRVGGDTVIQVDGTSVMTLKWFTGDVTFVP